MDDSPDPVAYACSMSKVSSGGTLPMNLQLGQVYGELSIMYEQTEPIWSTVKSMRSV